MMEPEDIYKEIEEAMQRAEKDLLKFVDKDLERLKLDEDGNVIYNQENIAVIYNIEQHIKDLGFANIKVFQKLIIDMLKMTAGIQKDYNASPEQMKKIKFRIDQLFYKMGYDASGNVIPGSFFYKISTFSGIAQQIADVLLNGIANKQSFHVILKSIREFIIGKKGVDGSLKRYLRQEVHDTIWKTNAAVNQYFAQELGLKFFVYSGSVMEHTRIFCEERNNIVFHVNDVESFPDDLSYFPPNYNFFIDRGGYNCRHKIRYISNELGQKLWGQEFAA